MTKYKLPEMMFKGKIIEGLDCWKPVSPSSVVYFAEGVREKAGVSFGTSRLSWAAYILELMVTGKLYVKNGISECLIIHRFTKDGNDYTCKCKVDEDDVVTVWFSDELPKEEERTLAQAAVVVKQLNCAKASADKGETAGLWAYFVQAIENARKAISPSSGAIDRDKFDISDLFRFCDAVYYQDKANRPDGYELEVTQSPFEPTEEDFDFKSEIVHEMENAGFDYASSFDDDSVSVSKSTEDLSAATESTTIQKAKDRKFFLRERWSPEQTVYIPSPAFLDMYVPCDAYEDALKVSHSVLTIVEDRLHAGETGDVIGNDYINVILCGKPGTGKTSLAYALGASLGMPVRTISMSKYSEEDTFEGKTKVASGGFSFFETPFLDVFENGGIAVLEEFNLIAPGVIMGAIGQAIEKPFLLLRDGHKEVHRHPLCIVICTMNTGTQGSQEPSEAFTSRCPNNFVLDDPKREDFIKILMSRGYDCKNTEIVFSAYESVQNYLKSSAVNETEIAMSVTLRHCDAALRQIHLGIPPLRALKNTLYGICAVKDLDVAKNVWENVLKNTKGL